MIFSTGFEIDGFKAPPHRPINLPHEFSRNLLIKAKRGPVCTVVARITNQAVIIGGNPGQILAAGFAINAKRIILSPALIQGFLGAVLGLIFSEDVEYIDALFNSLFYSLVVQTAPVCRRFTNILRVNTEPVHCPFKFGYKSGSVRVELSPRIRHIAEGAADVLLHRRGSIRRELSQAIKVVPRVNVGDRPASGTELFRDQVNRDYLAHVSQVDGARWANA